MRDHIKILGVLNIVMGCLTASIGLVALVILGGVAGAITWSGFSAQESGSPFVAPIISLIGIGFFCSSGTAVYHRWLGITDTTPVGSRFHLSCLGLPSVTRSVRDRTRHLRTMGPTQ
jgi:formate hydrogenlyase subunit 3/multisubunit Na+/H+ antiporter MnhD subunit